MLIHASIVHEVVYFGSFIPFWIADYIPALHKFKIQVRSGAGGSSSVVTDCAFQPKKENDAAQMWRCFKWLMFLHFCVEFPAMFLTHPMLAFLGIRSDLPLPLWCAPSARARLTPRAGAPSSASASPSSSSRTSTFIGFTASCTGTPSISAVPTYSCVPRMCSRPRYVDTVECVVACHSATHTRVNCVEYCRSSLLSLSSHTCRYVHKVHHVHAAPFGIAAEVPPTVCPA